MEKLYKDHLLDSLVGSGSIKSYEFVLGSYNERVSITFNDGKSIMFIASIYDYDRPCLDTREVE